MPLTLSKFRAAAVCYWAEHGQGETERHMAHRLDTCLNELGSLRYVDQATPNHIKRLVDGLSYLAPRSRRAYYATFKAAWRINGLPGSAIMDWPRLPRTSYQKSREPMLAGDYARLLTYLGEKGWHNTADLAMLLNGVGLRAGVEAYRDGAIKVQATDPGTVHITGKGARRRTVRVADPGAKAILANPARMSAIHDVGIDAHRWRWRKAVAALSIGTLLPSPHSLRHKYATELLSASGGNVLLVRNMLGHSNVATTATYIGPDLEAQQKALEARQCA